MRGNDPLIRQPQESDESEVSEEIQPPDLPEIESPEEFRLYARQVFVIEPSLLGYLIREPNGRIRVEERRNQILLLHEQRRTSTDLEAAKSETMQYKGERRTKYYVFTKLFDFVNSPNAQRS
eukprot:GHVP01062129.1.p1 GENE.GHVP01062129.1~~GHVP01062129.1.p1  ORF type:complete len:122 (+),score=20.56 GHVP01062129.1:199-564(+)